MRLADIVQTSRGVGATRSRLKKQATLAATLRAMAPDEVRVGVSYLSGVLPQGRIGIGGATLRALDAGAPAREPSLPLLEVHRRFDELASITGPGSTARRKVALGALFARATRDERAFLVRLVLGELRQGALVGVMVEAVSEATGIDAAKVRRAAMLAGSAAEVATAALLEGEAALARFELTLFRPVLPMLASPADDVDAALERLGEAAFELKLDGARVQVHKGGDEVRVYSRRLHEVTDRVPEIVEAARAFPARELILDGEAIALGPDGSPRSFQTTMRRFGRKQNVATMRERLPLSHLYFDVLYRDGESLIDRPARARIASLDDGVTEPHRIRRLVTGEVDEAMAFFEDSIGRGHEGLMAKSLDAGYEAGSRGFSWLKLKPSHTLDLVVIAVEEGSGRRRGWLSNLHLAARDPKDGSFVMLGKTFKGMTDEMLAWQTERLHALALGREGHVVHVAPELVVEIAFSDVQASPQYPAGMALRFARVKRYRTDKTAVDAATLDEVRRIFEHGHRAPGSVAGGST
ncbi:MAG TPA: ATP-dependent DNA ligase [Sandaracinaceae bacterium LLY-WYZ-13_1]|nr:ATP-dependent DNA ligase [Sandaracinaceae bacterium LLY-WYZ-13_1]